MREQLTNLWDRTSGIGIQLIAAIALVIIIGVILIVSFNEPNPETDLTTTEKSYPHATPQPFRHKEEKDTGTLVVTSNIEQVRVLLDASEHRDPEDPIPRGQKWPNNITPFTVESMPVGKHVLFAGKPPKYDTATVVFEIEKNQVTRVRVELIPLRIGN